VSGPEVFVCIRAEEVLLDRDGAMAKTSARNHVQGRIVSLLSEGPLVRVELDCGMPLVALITNHARHEMRLEPGDPVVAMIKATGISVVSRS
jgi:molybdate transport system ATP-binding protein